MSEEIQRLVNKYSPIFQYHSEEKYFPIHLREYFDQCELYWKEQKVADVGDGESLLYSSIRGDTPNNLMNPGEHTRDNNFCLKYKGEKFGSEHPEHVPCYAYVSNSVEFIDIVYFLNFSYSGEIAPFKIGTHDLDISHVICRLNSK